MKLNAWAGATVLAADLVPHMLQEAGGWRGGKAGELLHSYMSDGGAKHMVLLKGAIELADRIITVSPTYADEILSAPHGWGLEEQCEARHLAIEGVLNGIDGTSYPHDEISSRPIVPLK